MALAEDPIFWRALWQTLIWLALHVLLAGGLGLVLALVITRLRLFRVVFRTAFFLPHVVSLALINGLKGFATIWVMTQGGRSTPARTCRRCGASSTTSITRPRSSTT